MDNNSILIECIKKKLKWQDLSTNIKIFFGNEEKKYRDIIIKYSVSNQLSYKNNLVNIYVLKEDVYYKDIINYSCTNLMIYPYHLQNKIIHLLNTTSYDYYCTMIEEQVIKEKSYDAIPNFTAADCLQILGIGRNQYIDIVMRNKSNRSWSLRKKSIKSILPSNPKCWEQLEPWWIAYSGSIMIIDIETCNLKEKKIIDELIEFNGICCGYLDKDILKTLYHRDLIYFKIPIYETEYFIVPKLQNFVMNRVLGDYLETLMYKILLSLDENMSLKELSIYLDLDISDVKLAVSMLCRLGMIFKKIITLDLDRIHLSWNDILNNINTDRKVISACHILDKKSPIFTTLDSINGIESEPKIDDLLPDYSSCKRVALVYDSSLTAFLMVGNLSQELKTYAMTMFEMGKLTHEMMTDFMNKLSDITQQNEGEAKRYYENAINLLYTLKFLRQLPELKIHPKQIISPVDMIHNESLKNLSRSAIFKLFDKKYSLIISIAPLSNIVPPLGSCNPPYFGPPLSEFNSFWYRLFLYHTVKSGPTSIYIPHGYYLPVLPHFFKHYKLLYISTPDQTPSIFPSFNSIHQINEILKHSSAFIQGFSYYPKVDNKVYYMSFPINPNILNKKNSETQLRVLLNEMSQKLNMINGFGYISLLKLQKPDSSLISGSFCSDSYYDPNQDHLEFDYTELNNRIFPENIGKSYIPQDINIIDEYNIDQFQSKKYKWKPFEIYYGIPLFNDKLNHDICTKISQYSLFHTKNINDYVYQNRVLILQLTDFIIQHEGDKLDDSIEIDSADIFDNIFLYKPTKPVYFDKGQVGIWSIHDEL